ncbi:phospholipase A2 inhibitor PIP-like [Mantella aurantiaca]
MEPARSAWVTSPASCLIFGLALFITGGNALKCYECKDLSGNPCMGESENCQSGSDVCISSLVQYQIDPSYPGSQNLEVPTLVFMRSCGQSNQCSDVVTLRTPYSKMLTSNRCCNSDNCLPPRPAVMVEEPQNGLACVGCFNFTSDSCQDYKPVQCRGSELRCFNYTNQHLDGGAMALAGCATDTACNLDLGHDDRKTVCYGGCPTNYSPRITSSLSIAVLLMVLHLC